MLGRGSSDRCIVQVCVCPSRAVLARRTIFPFSLCYEEGEYERMLWDLIPLYSGRDVPKVSLPLSMLHRPFYLLYVIDHLDYWYCDCAFECRFHTHKRPLKVGWHNVEIFAILPRLILFITSCRVFRWRALEGHRLHFVATPPVFSSYSHHFLNYHAVVQLMCCIAM